MSIAWPELDYPLHDGTVGSGNPMTGAASLLTGRAPHSGRTTDIHERRSDDRHTVSSRDSDGGMGAVSDSRTRTFGENFSTRDVRTTIIIAVCTTNSTEALAGLDSSPSQHAKTYRT